MPYKNKNDKRKHSRGYYALHRDRLLARAYELYHGDREAILKQRAAFRAQNIVDLKLSQKRRYNKLKDEIISHYGGKCACCGEHERLFMELDHINNDGHSTRGRFMSSHHFYVLVKREGFPQNKYQLLCSNCNQGKERNGGICPHKKNTGLLCPGSTP